MPVRALVEAGRCFGIGDNSLRVALARLLARGRVERDVRGRYRLGSGAEPMRQQVASWRSLATSRRSWDGSWLMIHLPAGPQAVRRRHKLRSLGLEPSALVFVARGLDPDGDGRARQLWDVLALEAAYASSLEEIEEEAARGRPHG